MTTNQSSPLTGGVLLATHGGPGAEAAVRAACYFAAHQHVRIEALGVIEPVSPDLMSFIPTTADLDANRNRHLANAIGGQLLLAGASDSTPVVIENGWTAECIAHRAKVRGAALVALGIGPHTLGDRILTSEVAIALLRLSEVPVLAVPSRAVIPARSILIASDFSPASRRAARLALALAAPNATFQLVHAWPFMDIRDSDGPVWRHVYRTGVETLFAQMIDNLPGLRDRRVTTHIVQGEPERVIQRIARENAVDLIALGSHGRGFVDRLTLGSVTEAVVRSARASVLVAPATALEKEPSTPKSERYAIPA